MSSGTRELQDGFEGPVLDPSVWASWGGTTLVANGTAARGDQFVRLTADGVTAHRLDMVPLDSLGGAVVWDAYARFYFRIHQLPNRTVEAVTFTGGAGYQANGRLMVNSDGTWYVTVGSDDWGVYGDGTGHYYHNHPAGEQRTTDGPPLVAGRWYVVTIRTCRYDAGVGGHGYDHVPPQGPDYGWRWWLESTVTIGSTSLTTFRHQSSGEYLPSLIPRLVFGHNWEVDGEETYVFDYDGLALAIGWGGVPAPALPAVVYPPMVPYGMPGAILCPPSRNYALGAAVGVEGASALTNYPVLNAVDGSLDSVLRLDADMGGITIDLGASHGVNFVALLNHNLDAGLLMNLIAGASLGSDSVLGVSVQVTERDTFIDLRGLDLGAARYWRLEFTGANSRDLTVGEILIGNAYVLDKVMAGVQQSERYWNTGGVTEQQVRNVVHSGTRSRGVSLDLVLYPEDLTIFHAVITEVGVSGGRVFFVPDTIDRECYLLDWSAIHDYSVPNHRETRLTLDLVEQNAGVVS